MDSPNRQRRVLSSAHHALVLVLLVLACGSATFALRQGLRNRVGMEEVHGARALVLLAALALGLALCVLALALLSAAWARGRWKRASLAPLRALFVVGVVTWLGFLAWGQPVQRLHATLGLGVLGAAYGAWGFAYAACAASSAGAPRPALRIVDFALFNLALVPVGAELGLRALSGSHPSAMLVRPDDDASAQIAAQRLPPGWMHYGFPCNRMGCPDEEFGPRRPGEARVLLIADSFGTGVVPHHYHFATVTEELLSQPERPLRVDNLSVAGIGPREYLQLLVAEGRALEPDVIAVCLFVGNDLSGLPRQLRDGSSLRSWLDRGDVLSWVLLERLGRVRRERRRLAEGGEQPRHHGGTSGGQTVVDPAELAEFFPWVEDPLLESPTMSEPTYRECESTRATIICGMVADPYPGFLALLAELVEAAEDTPFGFVLIPDEFQVEDAVWEQVVRDLPGVELERDRPQRRITAWLEERGIPYVDVLPRLRAVEPLSDGRRHVYHLQDSHWNRRGNAVAAEAMADLVRRLLPD